MIPNHSDDKRCVHTKLIIVNRTRTRISPLELKHGMYFEVHNTVQYTILTKYVVVSSYQS